MSDNEKLLDLVNSSGFPFQLYLKDAIDKSSDIHCWDVLSSEHFWRSPNTGHEGFIDIILGSSGIRANYRAVIECKRTQDANWVFLTTDVANHPKYISSLLQAFINTDMNTNFLDISYIDSSVQPFCQESNFCVIRGHNDKDKPMLERLSTQLIQSVECLAIQELSNYKNEPIYTKTAPFYYFPIIVTNANLFTCNFNPHTVNPDLGKLESKDVKIEPIDYISFKKTLSSQFKSHPRFNNNMLKMINQTYERMVFIVKSTAILKFLKELEIKKIHS